VCVLSLSPLLLIHVGECVLYAPPFLLLPLRKITGLNRIQENCLPDHLRTECHIVIGTSSCRNYLFNTSHCSIAKLHLYPMWVLRRISQDSGDNTVCCNPFLLILLFNYSYMHSSVNVPSFTGILHITLS
jgi:hypothetical protein